MFYISPQDAGVGNNSITALGQVQQVADALSGLTYAGQRGDFSGADTIALTVVDAGGLSASRIIKVEVEASSPPAITRVGRLATLPRNLGMDEDGQVSVDALNVSVSNSAADSTVQVEVFCSNGVVSLPLFDHDHELELLTNTGTGHGIVVAGNIDLVNRALRLLVYRPHADVWGSDELTVVAREGTGGGSSNARWSAVAGIESIIILIEPVNDPPTIEIPESLGGGALPSSFSGQVLSLAGIMVHDADAGEPGGNQLVTVNASAAVEGSTVSLAMGPATVQGHLPGVLFLEGSAEGVYPRIALRAPLHLANSALDLLQFWAPYGQPGGLYNVTITVSDHGNWGKGAEEVASANVTIDLQYQQDPLVAGSSGFLHWDTPHGALLVDEDGQLHDLGIALVADSSASDDYSANKTRVAVTLEVDHGIVQVLRNGVQNNGGASVEVNRLGPGSLSVSGVVADVSAALAHSTYTPEPNFNGMETLELSVQEHLGDDGLNASVEIVVFPQPDAPTIVVEASFQALNAEVGSPLKLYGVNLQHADALDYSRGTVTLRAHSTMGSGGTVAMNGTQPGVWVYTEEEAGRVLVVRGIVENVQLALDSGALEYWPSEGYDGRDVIALSISADSPYGAFGDEMASLVEEHSFRSDNATAQLEITVVPAFVPAAVGLEKGPLFRTVEGSSIVLAGLSAQAPGRRDTSDEVVSLSFETIQGGVTVPGADSRQVLAEGQGRSTMRLTGTELEVNMALSGAVFKPTIFYNGVADIKVTRCLTAVRVNLALGISLLTGIGPRLTWSDYKPSIDRHCWCFHRCFVMLTSSTDVSKTSIEVPLSLRNIADLLPPPAGDAFVVKRRSSGGGHCVCCRGSSERRPICDNSNGDDRFGGRCGPDDHSGSVRHRPRCARDTRNNN